MLNEGQIEAIAQAWYEEDRDITWDGLSTEDQESVKEDVSFIAEKVIAAVKPYAEQDRRSFIAVANYIGVKFTSETDVVSEVYKKLEEIMSVFREHSQEIAIAQQVKHLTNLLEKYAQQEEAAIVCSRSMGAQAGRPVCAGESGESDA